LHGNQREVRPAQPYGDFLIFGAFKIDNDKRVNLLELKAPILQ
jgi:hypothetical protein